MAAFPDFIIIRLLTKTNWQNFLNKQMLLEMCYFQFCILPFSFKDHLISYSIQESKMVYQSL